MTDSALHAMPKDCAPQTLQEGMYFVARHLYVALTVPNPEVVQEYTTLAYYMAQLLRHTVARPTPTLEQGVQTSGKPTTRKRKSTENVSTEVVERVTKQRADDLSPVPSRAASPSLFLVLP